MSNFNKKLFKRLKLNHAYGQLIALIFVPIMIISCVGAALVLSETSNSAKNQQRSSAIAILSRYQFTAVQLADMVAKNPEKKEEAEHILQSLFHEQYVRGASIINQNNQQILNIGFQGQRNWVIPSKQNTFFGPIIYKNNNIYGALLPTKADQPKLWLMVELDNQPLEISRYRVLIAVITTGLLTLLLLLLCLNFYSRRWIAPMYEIRMQLQRLNADTLDQHMVINSTGELRLLQRDIANVVKGFQAKYCASQSTIV